jgi:hypothetical protein
MSGNPRPFRNVGPTGAVLVLALALSVLTGGVAEARVVLIHGKSYGVTVGPRSHGLSSRARRIKPLTSGGTQPKLVYHNGPLMLSSKLYLIFWDPEKRFSSTYTEPIIQYAKDLETDDSLTTDEFSVAEQYANGKGEHIIGEITLGGHVLDTTAYPALDEAHGCTAAHKPCVTDSQIQTEILKDIKEHKEQGWPTDTPEAPQAQYLLYTPAGVSSCIVSGECTFSGEAGYCAYHAQITGIEPGGRVATYSNLPDAPECDSGQAPTGVSGEPRADGTLDSEIHEIVESATDPAPETGYTDQHGEEAADKCAYPLVTTALDEYGAPLGGSLTGFTAFNQLIGGHAYYTQQMWSNVPTQTPTPAQAGEPAGCVARIGPTPSFTTPANGETGHVIRFDASGSYEINKPIAAYEWNYGDGSPVDTTSGVSGSHIYSTPGNYQVSLSVTDSSGSADSSTQTLPIVITGTAIGPPTAAIVSPAANQTYNLNQVVATSFSCTEASGGPGIESCTDSHASASPGALDTSSAGPHSYTVTAVSHDGQKAAATIAYTVTNPNTPPGSGGSNPGSGSSGGTSGTTASNSSGLGPSSNLGTMSTTPPSGAKPAALTTAQKLARAIKACQKLKKSKRARCVAAAKKRYAKKKHVKRRKR